ncbi:MAG: relaxase/mobilization nuclease domain-containing protein [Rhodospirillaceae bacterium]|nr:relaxase/mobilization nuclease domain-containing protein [Rhodospirillaceae bacterium]
MIAKRVKRTGNSSFGHLARYIAGACDQGEKLDELWIVNTNGGVELEDLSHVIRDIEATQALNSRSKADKTYHLIVSFRDEKPTPPQLREIEQSIATALGFDDHQRVVGTHQNTDNFHMHIAYNKIHPETLAIHSPFQDFKKLSKACREIEQKYELKIDLGMEEGQEINKAKTNQAAKDFEAHTWQQSLDGYVREHAEPLKQGLNEAKTWQDLHETFADYGLELKPRGNGMIIKAQGGKQMVKASTLERSFAARAKNKLGPFVAAHKTYRPKFKKTYEAKPTTNHKATAKLWNRYQSRKIDKGSWVGKAASSWKEFLKLEALNDPLAIAIIQAQKKILKLLTFDKTPRKTNFHQPSKKPRKRHQVELDL